MRPSEVIAAALELIAAVPGYAATAHGLQRRRIEFRPGLADRGQASLRGVILLGAEPFQGPDSLAVVSVAGTLVHEYWHTRQNPFLKTLSFWSGVATRVHPMRRYEWPAYRSHAAFLQAVADSQPALRSAALQEKAAVLASFDAVYGPAAWTEDEDRGRQH